MGSSSSRKALLEFIDEDQLAEFLGGKNKAKLEDNIGPWLDYDVVDGVGKDDIVGVRLKSDPDGKVFTPQDFEKLPNYIIGETEVKQDVPEGQLEGEAAIIMTYGDAE